MGAASTTNSQITYGKNVCFHVFLWSAPSTCLPFCLRPGGRGGPQTNWKASGRFPFVWLRRRRRLRDTVQLVVFAGGTLLETIERYGLLKLLFINCGETAERNRFAFNRQCQKGRLLRMRVRKTASNFMHFCAAHFYRIMDVFSCIFSRKTILSVPRYLNIKRNLGWGSGAWRGALKIKIWKY